MITRRQFIQYTSAVLVGCGDDVSLGLTQSDPGTYDTGIITIDETGPAPPVQAFEQILVLDKNWAVVVIDVIDALFAEMDSLSGGALLTNLDAWITSEGTDFTARANMFALRDTYIAQARKTVEVPLADTTYFAITGTDPNYSTPQAPANADRLMVSVDWNRYGYGFSTGFLWREDYRIYSYINFPTPLVSGESYNILLDSGVEVSFDYDIDATVSRAIKVNQVGYLPDAGEKLAYVGGYLYKFGPLDLSHTTTFDVVNVSSGLPAFSGPVTLVASNPSQSGGSLIYGEDVYVCDFSAMTDTGDFYIRIDGVGRSWTFSHNATIYDQVFYTTIRDLYHQRAGEANVAPYTDWTRQKAVLGPDYYESGGIEWPPHNAALPDGVGGCVPDYNTFGVVRGSIDYASSTPEVPGGYHDAADWDCRGQHFNIAFDLMYAYQWNPSKFTDNQFNIPESGNGVPDILSEVRQGLEVWRNSQLPNGGVSNRLETWTHADIHSTLTGGPPLDEPNGKCDYAYGVRTRWGSLIYAAAAAQYARLVFATDPADSAVYQASAIAAYDFGNNPANALPASYTFVAAPSTDPGAKYDIVWQDGEAQSDIDPYLMHSKLQLFLLTGTTSYLTDSPSIDDLQVPGRIQDPFLWLWTFKDYSPWIFYSLIEAEAEYPAYAAQWRAFFIQKADDRLATMATTAYKRTLGEEFSSGTMAFGNTTMTNYNRPIWIAYQETANNPIYRDAAILNHDFMYGANPMGMSWTTGIGSHYPAVIQHAVSTDDGIPDPVPGIALYGISGHGMYGDFRNRIWSTVADDPAITSITQTGGVATATTNVAHELDTGDSIAIKGANELDYNVTAIVTVTGVNTFEYAVDSGAPAAATGTLSWIWWWVSDPTQGTFNSDGSTDSSSLPIWRKWAAHPTENVRQCEFTVSETNSSGIFSNAMLFTNTETFVEKSITPPEELYGFWYTV